MYFGAIKNCDIANGLGVRVSLFVSGCTHHCKGCFQPKTWNFRYGEPYTVQIEQRILSMLAPEYIDGLTLLGGEPFEPQNQRELVTLLRKVRASYPGKDVWCYTGYTYESDLLQPSRARCEVTDEMLGMIDVLVDGEFVLAKRDLMLSFRGSSNQRLIDLNKTRSEGRVVLLPLR
ncbi:MAG: anaerobic ribonucleoside-triphosphate reductase activating protein [Duodenibacillus sp.]|nr:anaerobic ribonucleoside-triphosphate reductase activating protein [Duodenibacillus sp.]